MYTVRYGNKYGAVKTEYDGYRYDSKFEASVARDLDLQLKAGQIKGWERQFKVELWIYNSDGEPVHRVNHKVDFRVEHLDGTFELIEAKGVETADYKFRRMLLEKTWLNDHYDHRYTVIKQRR